MGDTYHDMQRRIAELELENERLREQVRELLEHNPKAQAHYEDHVP